MKNVVKEIFSTILYILVVLLGDLPFDYLCRAENVCERQFHGTYLKQ